MSAPSLDILLAVGDAEPRVESLAFGGPGEVSVTVLFPIGDATVSVTFDVSRFLAFVERLRAFAATMPGRPS